MPQYLKAITTAEGKLLNSVKKAPTEVDNLLERIAAIQKQCHHDFLLVEPIMLEESLVPGVYFNDGDDAAAMYALQFKIARRPVKDASSVPFGNEKRSIRETSEILRQRPFLLCLAALSVYKLRLFHNRG